VTDTPVSKAFVETAGERAADRFGMWVFLATEAMLFGAVLVAYFILRLHYPAGWAGGSKALSLFLGTLNTAILLTSSLAMAVAVEAAKGRQMVLARRALWVTAALGAAFVLVKSYEYYDDVERGLLPILGGDWKSHGPDPAHAQLFLNLYLAMTGMHAVHLLIGIALVVFMVFYARAPGEPSAMRITSTGLYWHFVDIVWVFLFPLLYLVQK
jgi:cytochrome c oxidase subunit 3